MSVERLMHLSCGLQALSVSPATVPIQAHTLHQADISVTEVTQAA